MRKRKEYFFSSTLKDFIMWSQRTKKCISHVVKFNILISQALLLYAYFLLHCPFPFHSNIFYLFLQFLPTFFPFLKSIKISIIFFYFCSRIFQTPKEFAGKHSVPVVLIPFSRLLPETKCLKRKENGGWNKIEKDAEEIRIKIK